MNSREDGMIDTLLLAHPTRVLASYRRYAKDDPLCCPSRTSTTVFEVKRDAGKPRLVAGQVTTGANPKEGDLVGLRPPATACRRRGPYGFRTAM